MARDVDDGFQTLLGWLSPSSTETQKAANHRLSIDACLKLNFGMFSFFRSGSYGHGTSVSGFSDIDYFAVIPSSRLKANSTSTLQEVRQALAQRFPLTGVTVRSPAVVVPFGTTAAERHEITPADAVAVTPGGSVIYDIPDRYQGWMRASPKAHNAWVNLANGKLDGRVKPLIRLIKAWNYYQSVGIRSFYLELRTTQRVLDETIIIYKYDLLSVLRHLRTRGLAAMQDPMNVSGLVYPCTPAVQSTALSKIDTAISRASKALEAERNGKLTDAFYWWDLFFGGRFPSYY